MDKLLQRQVIDIFVNKRPIAQLAIIYDCEVKMIRRIKNKTYWKYLTDRWESMNDMEYKKVRTKNDIENDPRVIELHKEFGFAGEEKWGWWCYLNDGYLAGNNSQTINEETIKDICSEINSLTKL